MQMDFSFIISWTTAKKKYVHTYIIYMKNAECSVQCSVRVNILHTNIESKTYNGSVNYTFYYRLTSNCYWFFIRTNNKWWWRRWWCWWDYCLVDVFIYISPSLPSCFFLMESRNSNRLKYSFNWKIFTVQMILIHFIQNFISDKTKQHLLSCMIFITFNLKARTYLVIPDF